MMAALHMLDTDIAEIGVRGWVGNLGVLARSREQPRSITRNVSAQRSTQVR
jgi:hypothetical protein